MSSSLPILSLLNDRMINAVEFPRASNRKMIGRLTGSQLSCCNCEGRFDEAKTFADIPPSVFHPPCKRTCASVKRFSLLQRTNLKRERERENKRTGLDRVVIDECTNRCSGNGSKGILFQSYSVM